ncbi:putative RNA-directed DNA polymerase [Helianthus annuus]|nr:putative RNA-directed DNA polymerase [Helianthus annuus]KAJ0873254.1 putative RNA-directed DNA polymerase [Helianthus annuus]
MMDQFYTDKSLPLGCNSSFISLIPKTRDPRLIKDFRPISLIGVIYKVIAKTLANRLKTVVGELVSCTQSAFISGRSILDGPLIVSEIISWAKSSKKKLFAFKVDFAKAYDSVNWNFLLSNLKEMNFPEMWRKWIKGCLKSGRASVLVNGSPTEEFQLYKGLRQGDPMSPFLFILAMEALDVIMRKAISKGIFRGITLPNEGPTVSHLCYADDVIFLGEWSEENIKNLNRILRCFFLCSGLKVNMAKSFLFGVGVGKEELQGVAKKINCQVGSLPFNFLGLPLGANMKMAKHWKPIIDKFKVKLSSWKANCLSFAGRVTLAKAVLGALPNYYLQIFKIPSKVANALEGIRRNFVWGFKGRKKKIKWIAWKKMVAPKKLGGLGIGDIRSMNLALLTKWWWKLKEFPRALWARVIKSIHENQVVKQAFPLKPRFVGMWKDIINIKTDLSKLNIKIEEKIKGRVGCGDTILFWQDNWVDGGALRFRFPKLYAISKNKGAVVHEFFSNQNGAIEWIWNWYREPREEEEKRQLVALQDLLSGVKMGQGQDGWGWVGNRNGSFSVADVRMQIAEATKMEDAREWSHWNNWVLSKVNLFCWKADLNKIPTKRALVRRGVTMHDLSCNRCGIVEEDADHVIARCLFARAIWWQICRWLKLPFPEDGLSTQGLLNMVKDAKGSKEWKKAIGVVIMTAMWEIWKSRNEKVFNDRSIAITRTVEQVKENSFLWIRCRSKFCNLQWDRWCDFNIRDIIM